MSATTGSPDDGIPQPTAESPISMEPVTPAAPEFDPKKGLLEGAGTILGGGCAALTAGAYGLYNLHWKAAGDEAFRDPLFWFVFASAWILAGILSLYFVRERPYRRVDSTIAAGLALIGVFGFSMGGWAYRAAVPSNSIYTVAVFDSETESGKRLVPEIIEQLEKLKPLGEFQVYHIKRVPIGESKPQRERDMLYWARQRGSHLAIGEAAEGAHLAFLNISPLGQYKYDLEGDTSDIPENKLSAADAISQVVRYKWGVAECEKEEWQKAFNLLDPLPFSAAQFYTGWALFTRGDKSSDPLGDLKMAADRFKKAIAWQPLSPNAATFHYYLGSVYANELVSGFVSDSATALNAAASELSTASALSARVPRSDIGLQAELKLATVYSSSQYLSSHVNEAEQLLRHVIANTKGHLANEARSRLVYVLGLAARLEERPAEQACNEAKTLSDSLGNTNDENGILRVLGLASCAEVLRDMRLLSAAEKMLEESIIAQRKGGFFLAEANSHLNLGIARLNYAERAPQDLQRFDLLEAAASEFADAALLFLRLNSSQRCNSLDGKAQARFFQAEQSTGETRVKALSEALVDFQALGEIPACKEFVVPLQRWATPARAELEPRSSKKQR